jgi:hypothetical protein
MMKMHTVKIPQTNTRVLDPSMPARHSIRKEVIDWLEQNQIEYRTWYNNWPLSVWSTQQLRQLSTRPCFMSFRFKNPADAVWFTLRWS